MKALIFLLVGFISGVVLALFLAPESGDVLRAQLGTEAAAERQRLNAEMHRSLARLHDRVDMVHADLTSYIQGAQQQKASDDVEPELVAVAVED